MFLQMLASILKFTRRYNAEGSIDVDLIQCPQILVTVFRSSLSKPDSGLKNVRRRRHIQDYSKVCAPVRTTRIGSRKRYRSFCVHTLLRRRTRHVCHVTMSLNTTSLKQLYRVVSSPRDILCSYRRTGTSESYFISLKTLASLCTTKSKTIKS
jgi:hypothetical protein